LADAQPLNKDIPADPARFIAAEKTIFYKLGERTLPIRVFQYGDLKNIVFINLHDNENTSVDAAKSILEIKGGTLIKIENNDQRVVRFRLRGVSYGFDPNRIFSRVGIEQTLKENSRISQWAIEEVEKFSQRFLALIPDNTSCIVALHNNTNEAYSVKTYLSGNQRQFDAKAVYADSLQDVDDIIFTTDSLLYSKMAAYGYNSILQDNVNVRKDGSLSVYCGEKGKRYINIETQHGKFDQYAEMLGKFLMIMAEENKNVSETFHDSPQIIANPPKPVDN
ncbi:MAG TPA: hypothetical protein VIV35_08020, partial [Chitinophagaceae bacterium]